MAVGPDIPFQSWVVTVETQHRIRLPTEVLQVAKWLPMDSRSTNTIVGSIGRFGGLQFSPEGGRAAEFRKILVATLKEQPAHADEAASDWMDLARYFATSWQVTLQIETKPGRITINLPAEPRKLGILPSAGEVAVVFASGEILEICGGPDWVKNNKELGDRLSEVINRARDALEDRTPR